MQVVIVSTANEVGDHAAEIIIRGVVEGRVRVLGVATGSSPLPVYDALARSADPVLTDLTAFALDEYVGLAPSHPQSYHSVIDREVTRRLGLRPDRVHAPNGMADRPELEGERYERMIADAGGIDLQILGIGSNGHIGFNEPTSSFSSRTRVKTLTPATRADNARFFDAPDQVPVRCITQGLGTIMAARQVVLVAHGSAKASAVAAMVEGPVTSMCPASILQHHPSATVVVDEAAAAGLEWADYFRFVEANSPG